MRLHHLDDSTDPRIAAYADIRERDLVGRQGHFIAEGEVVLRVLAEHARGALQSVLVSEKRVEKVSPFLSELDIDVFAIPDAVMEAVTGIELHRGILGLGTRFTGATPGEVLDGEGPAFALGLFGLANHDNVGGIFRNAAAFGARGALLDSGSCDPFYRKAIRVSVGGVFKVPFFRGMDPLQLVDAFEASGYECVALSPNGREDLVSARFSEKTALLLGAEGPGLDDSVLKRVRNVRIAMKEGFDSLNVAASSAIALHALFERIRAR